MTDYDVWLVHQYWTWHTAFHAENKDEVYDLIYLRLNEEGLPRWFVKTHKKLNRRMWDCHTPVV